MSHPNNNTQNETNYPSSDEYYSSDDNFELNGDSEAGTGAWRFLKMPTEANLCLRLNDADTFLLNTFIVVSFDQNRHYRKYNDASSRLIFRSCNVGLGRCR